MFHLLNLVTLLLLTSAFPVPSFLLKEPLKDKFYDAPSNLDSLSNGEVYDRRSVFDSIYIEAILARVEQVAYKTLDTQNQPSHSVVTVISPHHRASKPGIYSYQAFEDSANLDCSPSYFLAKDVRGWDTDLTIAIMTMLEKGHYVILPDHEGARSGFIAGHEEGHAGLDGIRAGINYLGLEKDTPVAIHGYSGGASATVWMASLAGTYSPELNIVGASHGGTPVDLISMIKYLDKADNLFSAFIVPAFAGLLNSYPKFQDTIWPHFEQDLKNALDTTRSPGFCFSNNVKEFGHQEWHSMMNVDIYDYEPAVEIFKHESLLSTVSAEPVPVPKFPRYIFHAEGDEIIPFEPVQQYVDEQCSAGANIQFVKWRGDDHETVEYLGLPDALKFSLQALEGNTPRVKCGTPNDDVLTWVSTHLGDTLGQPVAKFIKGLSKVTTPLGKVILKVTHGYEP